MNRGFTLIELLVIIAIIGVLAVVILRSLNDARVSAFDAKIETEMDGIAKRAEIEQNTSASTYDVVCGSGGVTQSPVIADLIVSIESMASSTVACNSTATQFAVSAPVSDGHWCIDSEKTKKTIPAALTSGELVCP